MHKRWLYRIHIGQIDSGILRVRRGGAGTVEVINQHRSRSLITKRWIGEGLARTNLLAGNRGAGGNGHRRSAVESRRGIDAKLRSGSRAVRHLSLVINRQRL